MSATSRCLRDLDRHAPRYILVEIRDPEAGRGAVEAVLGRRYALMEQLSPYDVLYSRTDVKSPLPAV